MRIKTVVEKTGLTRDTLRFYEKQGLIRSPSRKNNGYRDYDETVVVQLKMITRARELGFTLREIKDLTKLLYSEQLTQKEMAKQLEQKCHEIDRKISALQQIKNEIKRAQDGFCDYKDHIN